MRSRLIFPRKEVLGNVSRSRMDREGGGNENVPLLRDDQRGQIYLDGGADDLEPSHRGSVENVDDPGERRASG